jgi:CheY-like chemotaxis protein
VAYLNIFGDRVASAALLPLLPAGNPTVGGHSSGAMQIPPDSTAPPKLSLFISKIDHVWGCGMGRDNPLKGHTILIVEDNPLIRLELINLYQSDGAQVIAVPTHEQAIEATEQYPIRAALLDYGLEEENVAQLLGRFAEYQIPYIFYTGYSGIEKIYPRAVILEKPASGEVLLRAMTDLIVGTPPPLCTRRPRL